MLKKYPLVILLIFTTLVKLSYAQDLDSIQINDTARIEGILEEVIIQATINRYITNNSSFSLRLDGKLSEIPQNIQVLNNMMLADQQIFSMADGVAKNISGASKIEGWGDGYTYITMRGSRAANFRNGMNISSLYGLLSEDMSYVDRIEFVKGPAGFMMSNGEPSGIYNVVTKKPSGYNRTSVNMNIGSFSLFRVSADLDGVLSKVHRLQYRFNLSAQQNNSFRDYEINKRIGIAPVLQYQFDDKTKLLVEYIFQYAEMPDMGINYLFSKTAYETVNRNRTVSDPSIEPTLIKDQNITATLLHNFNENWKLTSQVSYFDYNRTGSFIWLKNIDELGNLQRTRTIHDGKNEMAFGQLFINGKFSTGKLKHKLLGGADLSSKSYIADFAQFHLLDSIGTFNINQSKYQKPYYGVGHFDRSVPLKERVGNAFLVKSDIWSLYLQDELSVFRDKLRITLAGRYTYVKDNNYGAVSENQKFTPRLGLSYSLNHNTNIYALFDRVFVPQTGRLRDGNEVKPLTGDNIEFGIKKDWDDGKWNTTLSLYRIMKNNQLSNDPDNSANENYVMQFGQTKTQGIEWDMKGELFRGMNIMANYAFTDSKITRSTNKYEKGSFVPGYAKHNLNTWADYRLQNGLLKNVSVAVGSSYQIDRLTWVNGTFEGKSLPDYFRLDGSVSCMSEKVNIRLNIYNILNQYLYNGAFHSQGWYYWSPEAPRNFKLNVTYNF